MSIIKAQNLDLNTFTFSEPKVDPGTKAKRIFVNSNGSKVVIQTPKMYVPTGITRWRKPDAVDNKDDSFEVEMSFGGDSADVAAFHQKMKEYDTIVKQKIQENSLAWIGKQKASMETIEDAFYIPTVKIAVDRNKEPLDYPDRIKAKIDRDRVGDEFSGEFISNKRFNTKVLAFDKDKNSLVFNESTYDKVIPKGSRVICILELVYIFCSKQVSTKWKLVQVKVFSENNSIDSYAIDDETEDEVVGHGTGGQTEGGGHEGQVVTEELAEAQEAERLLQEASLKKDELWADSVAEDEVQPAVKKTVRKKKIEVAL